jgi:GT2 family glycosyltransferase
MIIYDNNSFDGTDVIIDQLVKEGLPIRLMRYDDFRSNIKSSYPKERFREAFEKYDADLVILLDADEFLYSIDGHNPREHLESMDEASEYRVYWRTYTYQGELQSQDKSIFTPKLFNEYRNSKLETFTKAVASKYLVEHEHASLSRGNHTLQYGEAPFFNERPNHIPVVFPPQLVIAHYPVRSQAQIMTKAIAQGWIRTLASADREGIAFQQKIIYDLVASQGEIPDDFLRKYSLEYSIQQWDLESDKFQQLLREQPTLKGSIQPAGAPIVLKYTDYAQTEKTFLKTLLTEFESSLTRLPEREAEAVYLFREAKRHNERLQQELDSSRAYVPTLHDELTTKQDWINSLQDELATTQERVISLQDEVATKQKQMVTLQDKLTDAQEQTASKVASLQKRFASIRGQLNEKIRELHTAQTTLNSVLASRTWRYARWIVKLIRWFIPVGSLRARIFSKTARFLLKPLRRKSLATIHDPQFAPLPRKEYRSLVFPPCDNPLVSIIIPVHNQFRYTYNCLSSILETSGDVAYEVLIGDDASTDLTKKISKIIQGVSVVRNKPALGFLRNCNKVAMQGRGKYLVFLNNDTAVRKHWLQSMVLLIESDSSIGLVGSKILNADGSLQEAGGILWRDGSAWNFGRGKNAAAPEYNYVKEVDYMSGCSLLIRTDLWKQIGGFDERFAPAYCEDSDLAFETRKRGYRVVYQPTSILTHYEGISNGTDLKQGTKRYQVINQRRFFEKWQTVLKNEHYENGKAVFHARDRSRKKKTVVFFDHYVPTFDKDAGSRTMYEYIKLFLSKNYHVVLIPDNFARSKPYTEIYQQLGVEVLYGTWCSKNWKTWIKNNADYIDLFFMARPGVTMKYIDYLMQYTHAKILYYGMDLHFLREQRHYDLTRDSKLLPKIQKERELELSIIDRADCALYPSFAEEKYLLSLSSEMRVLTLPAFVVPKQEQIEFKEDARKDFLFVGGFDHTPNRDSVIWFVEEIFPKILEDIPDAIFHIVGSNAPNCIKALACDNIKVHGFVSTRDLKTIYASTRLAVVPLRYGAGIKGKIVEAMSSSVPVLTTSIGAEGFANPEHYLAIEDDPQQFARTAVKLYKDGNKLRKMVEAAYDYIHDTFGADKVWEVLVHAQRYRNPRRFLTEKGQ